MIQYLSTPGPQRSDLKSDIKGRHLEGAGPLHCKPMSVQASSRSGNNIQGAHVIMGELALQQRSLFNLMSLTQEERRALLFLTSVVSGIDKTYNYVDNYIEECGRQPYVDLANRLKNGSINGDVMTNQQIWDATLAIFRNACSAARDRINTIGPQHAEHFGYKAKMLEIIDRHINTYASILDKAADFIAKPAEVHMAEISQKGFR